MSRSRRFSEDYVLIIDPPINEFSPNEWAIILKENDLHYTDSDRLRQSLFVGIPTSMRGEIWTFISRGNRIHDDQYLILAEQSNSENETMIQKDLARTFPTIEMFKETEGPGQKGVLNILRAYSVFDEEIGYCQGMSFIVGLLLMNIKNAELTFWTFVNIMIDKDWRSVFKTGTPKLIKMLDTFAGDLQRNLGDVYEHIVKEGVEMTIFSWCFITLFICKAPLEFSVRIMDMFLCEGEQIIFSSLLKMMSLKKEKILRKKFEDLVVYFNGQFVKECFDEFYITTLLSPLGYRDGIDEDYEVLESL